MATESAAGARRYRAAVRHSGRVRFLRVAIPVGAALVVGAIAFIAIFDPLRRLPDGFTVGPLTINGTKVTMESPRLTGFKKDNRPYEVTAVWASQDIKTPNVIELREIKARIAMQDKGLATVEALNGLYDTKSEQVTLKDDVHVVSDSGYDAKLKSAVIEFKAGTVMSNEPVTVKFNGGTIEADALEVLDSGAQAVFKGRVRTVMQMESGGTDAAKKRTAP